MKKTIFSTIVVLLIVSLLSGCAGLKEITKDPIVEYHALIVAYQNGQKAAANGNTCLALAFSQMQAQTTLANNYLSADVQKTKAYREALAKYGTKFTDQQQAAGQNEGKPIDLGELAKNKATPADMGLTLQVYASTFNEAPLAQVNPEPILAAQRIVSEQYNLSQACIKDWNDAVGIYNIERNKIPGDIVGRIAEYLKVKELPMTLPYFSFKAPSSPPSVPTLGTVQ